MLPHTTRQDDLRRNTLCTSLQAHTSATLATPSAPRHVVLCSFAALLSSPLGVGCKER
jgi:hypothetical protein